MGTLASVALAIVGLAVIVLVHEAGHFIAASAVGIRPRRFFLFLPPKLVSVRRGDCEYGIGLIPLGGYVKLPGMRRPSALEASKLLSLLRPLPRLAEEGERLEHSLNLGRYGEALYSLLVIEDLQQSTEMLDSLRCQISTEVDELRAALSDGCYWRAQPWRRIVVVAAGPVANIVLAFVLMSVSFSILGLRDTTTIAAVSNGSPAQAAGLRSHDQIAAINSRAVASSDALVQMIQDNGGRPLSLLVRRGKQLLRLGPLTPVHGQGRWLIGVSLSRESKPEPAGKAIGDAGSALWQALTTMGASASSVFSSSGSKQLSGPVGIVQVSSQAIGLDIRLLPGILALISLSVAILNLLPVPPLDGGQIAIAIIERLRRRPLTRRAYDLAFVVGGLAVVLIFLLGLYNDVGRL